MPAMRAKKTGSLREVYYVFLTNLFCF